MHVYLKGNLQVSTHISLSSQSAFVLNDLKIGTLISLAKLCDDDCVALFSKYEVLIIKKGVVIIKGKRFDNGLWSVPLNSMCPLQVNGILRTDKQKHELG